MIKANKISFKYDDKTILKDISFELNQGEVCAVIGPSGTGKTTLLKSLTLLANPHSGSLQIDDEVYNFPFDADKINYPYPKVNILFQNQFLWPHLTLKENIQLVGQNIKKEKGGFTYTELVEIFGLQSCINNYPNQASLGQRQRVALARALITNPKYLFLDEITTFLDVKQIAIILDIIKGLKERGIGIFIITHYLNFMKSVADRVLFMDKGKIIEQGTADIISNPQTKELQYFLAYYNKIS